MGGPEGYGEPDVPSILESKQEDMGDLWRGGECKDTRIGMGGVAKLDVDRDFLCPICIQTMKDVFLTVCGHSFCYMCITTHLHIKNNCPCCGHYLTTSQLFPNVLLSKFLTKASACQFVAKASPMENIRLALTKGEVTVRELDTLLTLLQAKKQKAEQEEAEANMEILMEFLHRSREAKEAELNELQRDLQFLKEDISFVEKQRADLLLSKERFSKKIRILFDTPSPQLDGLASVNSSTGGAVSVARSGQSGAGVPSRASQRTAEGRYRSSTASSLRREASDDPSDLNGAESRGMAAKKRKIHSQFDDLQECYLQNRRKAKASKESSAAKDAVSGSTRTGLDDFNSVLTAITRYSKLRVIAELRHGDLFQSTNIISSIEFDKDDQFFATAGVSRRIKVFEYESVVNEAATVHCPISEMTTRSKLSCLSWNKYIKSHIASSDYEGIVTVWDVNTHQSIMEYEEHEKRAWSVDFSRTEPTRLVSGSDDGKVKVWCTRQDTSVLDIDIKAPICCVKYNPGSSNYVAVGSADTRVHYFDLRHTQQPLYMFDGHEKPVSYVKFLSQNELASASTDGTLRLWDVQNNLAIRTLQGHTNEKNFVGLTVNSEYIACGSETNEVFVYNKAMSKPTAVHRFGSDQDDSDDDASLFVSAVCWKSESPTMLAANSQGTIKVLVLAP